MADQQYGSDDLRRQSRRLTDASRELVNNAKAHIEMAHERLDRARNVVQATWLWRTLQQRRRGRQQ
jgi:hypothetical protein